MTVKETVSCSFSWGVRTPALWSVSRLHAHDAHPSFLIWTGGTTASEISESDRKLAVLAAKVECPTTRNRVLEQIIQKKCNFTDNLLPHLSKNCIPSGTCTLIQLSIISFAFLLSVDEMWQNSILIYLWLPEQFGLRLALVKAEIEIHFSAYDIVFAVPDVN